MKSSEVVSIRTGAKSLSEASVSVKMLQGHEKVIDHTIPR